MLERLLLMVCNDQPVKKLEQWHPLDLPVLDSSRDISADRQLDLFSVQTSYYPLDTLP